MWIYFIAEHGPGHQSTTDGFLEMSDQATEEAIQDRVDDRLRGCDDNYVDRHWKVPSPSPEYVLGSTRSIAAIIEAYQVSLAELKSLYVTLIQEKGKDEQLMEALVGVIHHSLLALLHKRKIIVTDEDISMWFWGKQRPVKAIRRKVMNAIKAADKYPSYRKGK